MGVPSQSETVDHRCPNCGNQTEVYRSETHFPLRDTLMKFFGKFPYRCRTCDERFYDIRRSSKG